MQVTTGRRWVVDGAASRVAFMARGFWGLAPVRGLLPVRGGEATIEQDTIRGSLELDAGGLDTGLALRDRHLRSPDFFDVERFRSIVFTIAEPADLAAPIRGRVSIKGATVPLQVPISMQGGQPPGQPELLRVSSDFAVELAAVGLDHSTLGMVRGPAQITVEVVLRPARG